MRIEYLIGYDLKISVVRLQVKRYDITINGSSIQTNTDTEYEFFYDNGDEFQTLYVKPEGEEHHKLMTARSVNDSLVLYHLEVPSNHERNSLGRMGVAFFYFILRQSKYKKYAIKFGGGMNSAHFLRTLGFPDELVHTGQDTDFAGSSVMVGEYESTGNREYDWKLNPVSIETFPTDFFKLS